MIFLTHWFSHSSDILLAWFLLIILLLITIRPALTSLHHHHSALPIAIIILSTAWCLTASTDGGQLAGMSYHLLGINLIALMIGIPATLWLGSLLLLPYLWFFNGDFHAYPINALALLLPSLIINKLCTYLVYRLPANIFIFIFTNGFIASALSILLTGLILIGILDYKSIFPTDVLWSTAFPIFFLITWAEAFLSGIITAIFVTLKPHWIHTFDDNHYLKSNTQIW